MRLQSSKSLGWNANIYTFGQKTYIVTVWGNMLIRILCIYVFFSFFSLFFFAKDFKETFPVQVFNYFLLDLWSYTNIFLIEILPHHSITAPNDVASFWCLSQTTWKSQKELSKERVTHGSRTLDSWMKVLWIADFINHLNKNVSSRRAWNATEKNLQL